MLIDLQKNNFSSRDAANNWLAAQSWLCRVSEMEFTPRKYNLKSGLNENAPPVLFVGKSNGVHFICARWKYSNKIHKPRDGRLSLVTLNSICVWSHYP